MHSKTKLLEKNTNRELHINSHDIYRRVQEACHGLLHANLGTVHEHPGHFKLVEAQVTFTVNQSTLMCVSMEGAYYLEALGRRSTGIKRRGACTLQHDTVGKRVHCMLPPSSALQENGDATFLTT